MRQNPEKEILPTIGLTGAKQQSSNALRRTLAAQLSRCLGCTRAERASQSTTNTPVPTAGEQATQERGTAVSVSAVFHCHLHPLCEEDYSGQDWFEANSRHLLGERGSVGWCITS